jgi:penicillin amidase
MFKLDTTGYFSVFAGPSMRTVIEMANINSAESINPTGQSGHFLSPHYDDQAKMFVNVEFRAQLMDSLEISDDVSNHLTFIPKN